MKRNIVVGMVLASITFVTLLYILQVVSNEPMKLDESEIKELVYQYSVGNMPDDNVSINASQLIITDGTGNESSYTLPEKDFFVSIAPYMEETHPCTFHNLTSCQGEMVDVDFDFYIENQNGTVVLDESINSGSNGFIDLWLPRDNTYQIIISHEDKMAKAEFSTFSSDITCITTMQMQ